MILFFLVPFFLGANGDWEIGVATEHQVELLNREGQLLSTTAQNMSKMNALTYDPIYGHLYFSDSSQPNASIFQIEVAKDGRTSNVKPVVKKIGSSIEGLAHDPLSSMLFWTTGVEKTIMTASLKDEEAEPKILLTSKLPKGIAVDPCQRQLFWTNCYTSESTIERSLLDGSKRLVLIKDLFLPVSITISQEERMIYWVEVFHNHFSVTRAALDGTQIENVIKDKDQQPFSIAVTPNHIYWTDFANNAVWSANKTNSLIVPHKIKMYHRVKPRGIVALSQYDKLDESECKNLKELQLKIPSRVRVSLGTCFHGYINKSGGCDCVPGYNGHYCEVSVCHNYCLGSGNCTFSDGGPVCSCPETLKGDRCEIRVCAEGLCMNNGTCVVITGQETCSCTEGYFGDRCQFSTALCDTYCTEVDDTTQLAFKDCSCETWALTGRPSSFISMKSVKKWQIISWSLMGVLSLFIFIFFGMLYKIYGLSSRPKLVRRFQPTQGKNAKTADHCEIAIENCCNMNICEIPCYEPEFRTPKGKDKKGEKKTLLDNEVLNQNTDLF
ncbi:protein cueball [Cimex lectularius]|uniref:Protein cueball n=1 Tax=Cimex lectularius TaxID=79782 RepID=A0A8I6RN93_CIMLE|nr:protein cueball [Cimex lectularius]